MTFNCTSQITNLAENGCLACLRMCNSVAVTAAHANPAAATA